MNLNTKPFDPKNSPVGYHWVILSVGTLGVIMSVPGQTIGVSAFTDKLIEVLGITRIQFADAYMLGTIGSACSLPFVGGLYDKYGARVIFPIASVIIGVVLFALSYCDEIVKFTGSFFATMAILFLLLRLSGQGVMTMVSRNMVMKWFRRKRGMASSVIGISLTLSFSIAPKVFDMMIQAWDWRVAWQIIGAVEIFIIAVFAILLYRETPEDCGMLPDGDLVEEENSDISYEPETAYTLIQAIKTPAFWLFSTGMAAYALYLTAISFHITSIFETVGLGRTNAMNVFPPAAVLSVFVSLMCGWLADRIHLKYLLALMTFALALCALGLIYLSATSNVGFYLLVAGNGISMGTFGIVSSVTFPRFFGREHLGKITGVNMAYVVFGSAIGPTLFARGFEYTDSYVVAGNLGLAILLCLTIASLFTKNPNEKAITN